jgi:hypothetical protein
MYDFIPKVVIKLFICTVNVFRAYDFQSVITSSSLIYGFALGAPSAVWFVFKQYEPNLLLMSTICLYGYSLTIYVPAVVS